MTLCFCLKSLKNMIKLGEARLLCCAAHLPCARQGLSLLCFEPVCKSLLTAPGLVNLAKTRLGHAVRVRLEPWRSMQAVGCSSRGSKAWPSRLPRSEVFLCKASCLVSCWPRASKLCLFRPWPSSCPQIPAIMMAHRIGDAPPLCHILATDRLAVPTSARRGLLCGCTLTVGTAQCRIALGRSSTSLVLLLTITLLFLVSLLGIPPSRDPSFWQKCTPSLQLFFGFHV